jgi:sulfatase modifying factor 1
MSSTDIKDFSNLIINGIPCSMRFVEGGRMDVGEGKNKHSVTIPSFYMGQYQVTQSLYQAIMETNPSRNKGENRPVTNVNWDESRTFIDKLKGITGKEFRLPSESEWEYAARGGLNSQKYEYCGSDDLKQVGWYRDNSGEETKPVGLLLPNELGLYDMSGNVDEWCEDDYHDNYKDAPKDGSAWIDGETDNSKNTTGIFNSIGNFFRDKSGERATDRVVRGGNFLHIAGGCRPAYRDRTSPGSRDDFIGFRLVFSLQS